MRLVDSTNSARHVAAADSTPLAAGPTCLLSIDLDDQLMAVSQLRNRPAPSGCPSLERQVRETLDVLTNANRTATIFVNAQLCRAVGPLLKEMVDRGHILASHGYQHGDIRRMTLSSFSDDLRRSIDELSTYQDDIVGYRPPGFYMPYTEPYFEVLAQNGIKYISSGVALDRSNAPRSDLPVGVAADLVHVPISTWPLVRNWVRYPIGYGVVSRLLPEDWYLRSVKAWVHRKPFFHYYCHSFEVGGVDGLWVQTDRSLISAVYRFRCQHRQAFFTNLFRSFHFEPIETWVLRHMPSAMATQFPPLTRRGRV